MAVSSNPLETSLSNKSLHSKGCVVSAPPLELSLQFLHIQPRNEGGVSSAEKDYPKG